MVHCPQPSYMQSIISIGIFDKLLIQKLSLNNANEYCSPSNWLLSIAKAAHFLVTVGEKSPPNCRDYSSYVCYSRIAVIFLLLFSHYCDFDGKALIFLLLFPLTECWCNVVSFCCHFHLFSLFTLNCIGFILFILLHFSGVFEFHFYLYYVLITF